MRPVWTPTWPHLLFSGEGTWMTPTGRRVRAVLLMACLMVLPAVGRRGLAATAAGRADRLGAGGGWRGGGAPGGAPVRGGRAGVSGRDQHVAQGDRRVRGFG